MADNNKVTIDSAWFAELYAKWKGAKSGERPCEGCPIVGDLDEMRAECGNLRKERDELKKKLEATLKCYESDRCAGKECYLNDKLAAAERCIEDCWGHIACGTTEAIPASLGAIEDIIRAYHEKEAAR